MNRSLTAPALCLAAAATLACAAPARAQTSDTVPSVFVKYADLNLGSRGGAEVLLRRIDAAATTVCGGAPDLRRLNQVASFEACRRSAVARAVAAVDSPMLATVAHRGSAASFAAR